MVAIDAKRVADVDGQPRYEIFTHGGRRPTGIDAVGWARRMAALGAGELLLTSMDRDGTRDGFELGVTRAITEAVEIPVIASGGVGTLEHLAEGILAGGADAVLAASIFHFGEFTIAEAKEHLRGAGHRGQALARAVASVPVCPGLSRQARRGRTAAIHAEDVHTLE